MAHLIGLDVSDFIKGVFLARFHTVEGDAPNLQLVVYPVENYRIDVTRQEEGQG